MIWNLPQRCRLAGAAALLCLASLTGCAGLASRDAPIVRVVGMEPLAGESFELRFLLSLRVQNPDDMPLGYDGVNVRLAVDGYGLASGVGDVRGEIPRYSEAVIKVPVSVSAFAAFQHLLGRMVRLGDPVSAGPADRSVDYELTGWFGSREGYNDIAFRSQGQLRLPGDAAYPAPGARETP